MLCLVTIEKQLVVIVVMGKHVLGIVFMGKQLLVTRIWENR
jgi:hypothetical protein